MTEQDGCTCEKCVAACEHRPCWGTPREIKKLIKEGYANRLMEDWWAATPNIIIISPACEGHGGLRAPDGILPVFGRCVFLDSNNLCEIHAQKPEEGRDVFGCRETPNVFAVHEAVAMTWDSSEGRRIVKMWRKKMNL